jgi:UDPglucose--hexose-1-phosphate uridylyltransferase
MNFDKVLKISQFLDPGNGFAETKRFSEVRYDPLTGYSTRILDFPVRAIVMTDLSQLIETSRQFCPFCPETVEFVTPKFHPDLAGKDRYACGEALCVPNAFPYDENGAVTVMTHKHYVALNEFTPEVMTDAFICCFQYLSDVVAKQPDMVYQSVNWNYMPLAGGSLIHPHLQIAASSSPTNYYASMLPALVKYRQENNSDFWVDLVEEERKKGERMIADDETMSWVVAFAPMGIFDILGIIRGASSPADITGRILYDLVNGVLNVMRYIESLNMQSLNMSLYFYLGRPLFTPHVRICPRVGIPPFDTSQINYMGMLHNETLTILRPEDICMNIKPYWGQENGER